jgi:hypothetical protein
MKLFQVLLALAILSSSLISISVSSAKPAYAAKEHQKCVYCHASAGKPDLNDTGKCYKANDHSLAKCAAPTSN